MKLDVASCMTRPPDAIPPADWTSEELALMHFMLLEYHLSVGDIEVTTEDAPEGTGEIISPTFSGPNAAHRSKNFSLTRALTGQVQNPVFPSARAL